MSESTDFHHLYEASLGGDGVTMVPAMALALDTHFGGLQHWRDAFTALVQAGQDGAGYALLVFRPGAGALCVLRAANPAALVDGDLPILALDCSAPDSVNHFLAHIDWAPVYARYAEAVQVAGEPFGAGQDAVETSACLLDVRRAGVYQQAASVIPGAQWRDPAAVGTWAAELPRDRAVLVYCVYGHEVGRVTALRLRAMGVDARYLQGGIDGWIAAGQPTCARPEAR
ncbi:MAG: superoxide dismutase [Burkholderiales bacterium PBB5]|nr:MAG: superoxide dismutase [Burkholderiales bacterium PBB5]